MKRYLLPTLLLCLLFLLPACNPHELKPVFQVDLRGAELEFDGDKTTMREGYFAMSRRMRDGYWQLTLQLPGYEALVMDQTDRYAINGDCYQFSNGEVELTVETQENGCGIYIRTTQSVYIAISWWPSMKEDSKKIRKAFDKYIVYYYRHNHEDVSLQAADTSCVDSVSVDETFEIAPDPDLATNLKDVEYHVTKERIGNSVYYSGESDIVMSAYRTKIYVEVISNPDPSKGTDYKNSIFFLDYSGIIGQDAIDILNRYNGDQALAKFYFEDGSYHTFQVSVDDNTPSEWKEMNAGLGDIYLAFSPLGTYTNDNEKSMDAFDSCTTKDIAKITIDGTTIDLIKQGFHTGFLYSHLFMEMGKNGAFGPRVKERMTGRTSSSARSSTTNAKPESPSPKKSSSSSQTKRTTNPANNHEWVDLGLSVKWATCNIGASSPEDYGDYFAWGEVSPKKEYTWENYVFRINGDNVHDVLFSKYNTNPKQGTVDNKTRLDYSDDAARKNWGGQWRIPSEREWQELCKECTMTWTTQNSRDGYRFTSKKNGKSIFLPASGEYSLTKVDENQKGAYWSSNRDESDERTVIAGGLVFTSSAVYMASSIAYRFLGQSISPVTD